jgi:hypothetical protein
MIQCLGDSVYVREKLAERALEPRPPRTSGSTSTSPRRGTRTSFEAHRAEPRWSGDGEILGVTPFTLSLADGESADITIRLGGHREVTRTISDGDGELDVALARLRSTRPRDEFPGLAPPP